MYNLVRTKFREQWFKLVCFWTKCKNSNLFNCLKMILSVWFYLFRMNKGFNFLDFLRWKEQQLFFCCKSWPQALHSTSDLVSKKCSRWIKHKSNKKWKWNKKSTKKCTLITINLQPEVLKWK